jgi:hypothetical protein
MGSFNEICALSGLQIQPSTKVKCVFLTQNPYVACGQQFARRGCYHYDQWFLRTVPIDGVYYDYGRAEYDHNYLTELIEKQFSEDIVVTPWGHNKYHSHGVFDNSSIEELFKLASQGRLRVYDSGRERHKIQPLPCGYPTWQRIRQLIVDFDLEFMDSKGEESYNAQDISPGVVFVSFNSYGDNKEKLEKINEILIGQHYSESEIMDNKKIVIFGSQNPTISKLKCLAKELLPNMDVVQNAENAEQADVLDVIKNDTTKIVIISSTALHVNLIRKDRKDIFLIAFHATNGKTSQEQYLEGLNLCKKASCNLVFVYDFKTLLKMVVVPEENKYHETTDWDEALRGLMEIVFYRSHLTFTRSTLVDGEPIPWSSDLIPNSLKTVVNYCIGKNAYKPFNGVTAGHFACKLNNTTFLTSIRKTNFNDLDKNGLVKIVTDGPDTVLAYGAKPSVGGQSQRIVFHDHPGLDCILHFHCEKKDRSLVPVVSQREFECGSHQCGQNTSNGLKQFGNIWAVYLDQHGPNIIFNRNINPQELIDFIEANFDLSTKTGGFVSVNHEISN